MAVIPSRIVLHPNPFIVPEPVQKAAGARRSGTPAAPDVWRPAAGPFEHPHADYASIAGRRSGGGDPYAELPVMTREFLRYAAYSPDLVAAPPRAPASYDPAPRYRFTPMVQTVSPTAVNTTPTSGVSSAIRRSSAPLRSRKYDAG